MPVFVNPLAGSVLFAIHLALFLLRHAAAVRLPVLVNLLMDVLLSPF